MALRPRRKPVSLDAIALAPALHEAMPIGDGETPSEVLGFRDSAGRIRRLVATYPNGWKVTAHLNAKNQITRVETSIKLTTTVRRQRA